MDSEAHHGLPHEPAPPEPRHLMPPRTLLVRGLGLATLAVALAWAMVALIAKSWFLAPLALALGLTGVLSAWGAAVQLTGGVKHDDHPFV